MDPATILAVVGGVCMVIKSCLETHDAWKSYQERKKSSTKFENVKDEENLSQALKFSTLKVQAVYNRLVLALGGRSTRSGDETIRQDFKKIAGKQQRLKAYLRKLQDQSGDLENSSIRSICQFARSIEADLTTALRNFAQRTTDINYLDRFLDRTENHNTELDPGKWPRKFCYGALLLQSNNYLDAKALASDPTLYILGFICKHCNLQVGDYRMSERGKTVVSTRFLAASHITSCASFFDRRAAYKCLPCYAKNFDIDFPSAAALEQHLKKHPDNKHVKEMEEKDVAEELSIDLKKLGLEPEEHTSHEDQVFLIQEDYAESSAHGEKDLSTRPVKTKVATDAVSISSISESEPKAASNSPWESGPAPLKDDYSNQIPKLDSNNHLLPSDPSGSAQRTSRPGSSYSTQAPPHNIEYTTSNNRAKIDSTSRNYTSNTYPSAPGYATQSNTGYHDQPQVESHYRPPPSRKAPSFQSNYPEYISRNSSESALHKQATTQEPIRSMPDTSVGYDPQQQQSRLPAEQGKEKKSRFWKKDSKS